MPDRASLSPPLDLRYPRLLGVARWLQGHRRVVFAVALAMVAGVLVFDLLTPAEWIAGGFYLLPLALIAVTLHRTGTALTAVLVCVLVALVMVIQHVWDSPEQLLYLYFIIIASGGLVVLSDLWSQLDEVGSRAIHRARLAQAEADIVGQTSTSRDLTELAGAALRRVADEVGADVAMGFVLNDGWHLATGVGVKAEAFGMGYDDEQLPMVRQALEQDQVLAVSDAPEWFAERGLALPDLVREYDMRRVLSVPLRAFDRPLGAMVFNRPSQAGAYSREQMRFAESVAGHVAVAMENARLMAQLDARRRDLSLVVESSLDFAASLEPRTVIEAVVERLVTALDVSACDIHVFEPDLGSVRTLVSYDNGRFDFGEVVGRLWPLSEFAATKTVVETGRPIVIESIDDDRLTDRERRLLRGNRKTSQLGLPLKVHERVIGLVELFDDKPGRRFLPEAIELAEAICQFAALAIDNAHLYDTERESAERLERLAGQLQTLQEISYKLGRLRDESAVLREVVESGAELLDADISAYAVHDRDVIVVKAFHDRDGFSATHVSGAEETVQLLQRALPALAEAARGDEDQGDGTAGRAVPVDLTIVREGALIVPLKRHRPDAVAALVFRRARLREFGDDDRRLATTLASQLSLTLRNMHAFQREHQIAETFQTALLVAPPVLAGAEIGVRYQAASQAARVGGDFYDILSLGPGRVMIAVGDVCGRGLDAALETALVRYTLRAYAQEGSPGEALSRLNAALLAQDPDLPFVTVVVAYLDVVKRRLEFAVAGHPRPLVLAGRRKFSIAKAGGFPVSLFPGETYPTNRCVLPEDTTLVFFTDGLTEARRNGHMLGERGLRETVRRHLDLPAQELADALTSRAARYAGGRLEDDMAAVVVRLP